MSKGEKKDVYRSAHWLSLYVVFVLQTWEKKQIQISTKNLRPLADVYFETHDRARDANGWARQVTSCLMKPIFVGINNP